MKPIRQSILLLLIFTSAAYGQQRNLKSDMSLPAPPTAGTVTLSLAEYNRLSELAMRKPKTTDQQPPVPFVLSRSVFKLRIEDQSVTGSVDIDGAVLKKGAAKVPITTGLTILDAKQSGIGLPLLQEGPTHSAILNGPGPFSISMTVASALAVEAGRASFVVPVPPSSSSLLSLDLPGNHANVRVEPGLITSRTTVNGHTLIEATLEPGKPARVWWTTREISAPVSQRELRFLSDIKSVFSVADSQLRITALCDVTVVQGEAAEFVVPLPAGFELTEVNGGTLASSERQADSLILRVREPARRNYQFLVALERSNPDSKLDLPLLAFTGAQRETGELLVEGAGAMELAAHEAGGLRRMDIREAGAITRSLSRFLLQAAFRYNRRPGDTPRLQLELVQFPDMPVLSAIAENATITTLANVAGKSLTEVTLRVRNHAKPFLKVELPSGAQILSAEVEGERVKPVQGPDGSRVPLLRNGLDSSRAYTVSFVYLASGPIFVKSGGYEMSLPKLDLPVNLLTWEVSLPDRLEVKQFGGNALAAELFPAGAQSLIVDGMEGYEQSTMLWAQSGVDIGKLEPGQIGGIVTDQNGAVVPGAVITANNTQTGANLTTTSDAEGRWLITGMSPGPVKLTADHRGFKRVQIDFEMLASQPARMGITLEAGNVTEAVTVTGSLSDSDREYRRLEEQARKNQLAQLNAPSQNVLNLQRRVAGILPVRVEVPRVGKSYRFVRPLVFDEETKITFQYKAK